MWLFDCSSDYLSYLIDAHAIIVDQINGVTRLVLKLMLTTRCLIRSMWIIVVQVDVCDYSIADPCDVATQLMFRLIRPLDSCYIRRYFGAISKIPVILKVLWCYQRVILYEMAACKKLDISGNRFSILKLL